MSARLRFWLGMAALILFSRIFQTHVLWPEETLPLAAGQHLLAGHTLYRDVWFDKPPLLAWFYEGVLRVVGHSGYGLRLIGVLYILAVCIAGYGLARRLWDETAARWTAFFLAFFTGFYMHSATVPLAADLLLVLPHLAVFYFLVAGRAWLAGLCAGLAFHLNSKALFVLAAAIGWILLSPARRRVLPLIGGFAAAAAAGLALVAATGAWGGYVEQVWRWGASYAGARFTDHPWSLGFERTYNYLGFHAALVLGADAFFGRRGQSCDREGAGPHRQTALWLAISFAAVVTGGRFFPRYYFQILPPLAVAAGIGCTALARRPVFATLLVIALAVPAVRFGHVNLWLATGRRFVWRDIAMDADSRRAGIAIARWSGPGDKIFVWGFRPEIYFYSRRNGASRFLESQPLTGVLADRHLQRSDAFLPEGAARHRRELAEGLRARPPVVIIDGLGPYNPALAMEHYSELQPVLAQYRIVEETKGARLYRFVSGGP